MVFITMEAVVILVLFVTVTYGDLQVPLSLPALDDDIPISNIQLLIPMKNPGDSKNLDGNVVMVLETPNGLKSSNFPIPIPPLTPLFVERSPSLMLSDDNGLDVDGLSFKTGDDENDMILLASQNSVELVPGPANRDDAEANLRSSLQFLCASMLRREQVLLSQPNESLRRSQESQLPPIVIRNLCRIYLQGLEDMKEEDKPRMPSAPFRNLHNQQWQPTKNPNDYYDPNLDHLHAFLPHQFNQNAYKLGSIRPKNKPRIKTRLPRPTNKKFKKILMPRAEPEPRTHCSICDLFHQHVEQHMTGKAQFMANDADDQFKANPDHGPACPICQIMHQVAAVGEPLNRHRRSAVIGERYPGM